MVCLRLVGYTIVDLSISQCCCKFLNYPSKTSCQKGLKILIISDKYCGLKCEILVKQAEVLACRSLTQGASLYLKSLLIHVIFKDFINNSISTILAPLPNVPVSLHPDLSYMGFV